MGTFSIWHWIIVLAVVLLLFGGRGKISAIMGDFGKGLKSFKKGMKEEDTEETAAAEPRQIKADSQRTAEPIRERDEAAKS
jgi:sec-independent protein translocase protein TatA